MIEQEEFNEIKDRQRVNVEELEEIFELTKEALVLIADRVVELRDTTSKLLLLLNDIRRRVSDDT